MVGRSGLPYLDDKVTRPVFELRLRGLPMKRWIVTVATVLIVSLAGVNGGPETARAQGTPTAGPVQEFFVEDGRVVGLSPDGSKYAVYIPRTELCVSDAATLERITCASFEDIRVRVRLEDIVWSPDSTRLAFAEEAFSYGDDGDLWVMDATTGDLTNLTDDGFSGSIFSFDDPLDATFHVDVAPAWTPDSQFITFSRSSWIEGERGGNDIAQVSADGGTVETLATASTSAPGVVFYGTQWAPDGETFYYSLNDYDADNPDNGIWAYDKATGETAQFAVADTPDLGPLGVLEVSPAGDKLLAWYPEAFGRFEFEEPLLRLVDIATGAVEPVDVPSEDPETLPGLTKAIFSPDGSAMLLLVDPGEPELQLWVTNLRTGEQTLVIDELEDVTVELFLTPTWGANGNVMVARGSGGGYLTSIEGIGVSGVSTAGVSDPVASPVSGEFAPGSEAITTELTPVFASPDPNAAVVLLLVPNQTVQIVSEPIENDFGLWYPIVDPDTQTIGYVQADRLGTSA
jgi:Tol biopolymer transport system component